MYRCDFYELVGSMEMGRRELVARFNDSFEYLFGYTGLIRGFVASFDVDESRESFSGSSLTLEASVERIQAVYLHVS